MKTCLWFGQTNPVKEKTKGIKQGSPLSPNEVIRTIIEIVESVSIEQPIVLVYVVNTVVVTEEMNTLQCFLYAVFYRAQD